MSRLGHLSSPRVEKRRDEIERICYTALSSVRVKSDLDFSVVFSSSHFLGCFWFEGAFTHPGYCGIFLEFSLVIVIRVQEMRSVNTNMGLFYNQQKYLVDF